MKKQRVTFTLGDVFPDKPGMFSKDVESAYDEFVRKRKLELKRAAVSWKRKTENNKNARRDH